MSNAFLNFKYSKKKEKNWWMISVPGIRKDIKTNERLVI